MAASFPPGPAPPVPTTTTTTTTRRPELRLILIGEREAGKSAAGNAILGRRAFDAVGVNTRASLRKRAMVRGWPLVLVDTPGWEWFSPRGAPIRMGAAHTKNMVCGSVELCQPGPHGLLLVVPLGYSFGPRERQVAEAHVQMFGGRRAWRHTLVLFTIADRRILHDCTLDEEVEDNDELRALVEQCGGGYHALYRKDRRGEDQVGELLAKIRAMVEGNAWALLPSQEVLQEASRMEEEEARREEEESRAEEKEVRRRREALKRLQEEEDAD
ncbi:GTPase IMAP family member 4, partial [Engraulis encrasicolus]|uniref:GTPase IMAP family member 4 n=1 Tax=Engraulis encrasicolus TaxID=184585 RepID=UPI002FD5ED4C